jgi:hypothetical protein
MPRPRTGERFWPAAFLFVANRSAWCRLHLENDMSDTIDPKSSFSTPRRGFLKGAAAGLMGPAKLSPVTA